MSVSTFESTEVFTSFETLVIKKLPMFLSVLNESNGDSEKILLVSVLCCSSVNFFRTMDLLSSCEFEI